MERITRARDEDVLFASCGENFADPPMSAIPMAPGSMDWVLLNVGGKHFATTRRTLVSKEPNSMLAGLFDHSNETQCLSATDAHGAYLIDRCPAHFEPLLNYLRHGQLVLDRGVSPRGVLEEARFFGIESLIPELERISRQYEADAGDAFPLNRNDVVTILGRTSDRSELSLQGEDLSGADLSGLDLRHIDFRWAKLRQCRLKGTDLSYCCLESADLTHANLEDAHLVGAKMMHANLENAYLRSTTMGDLNGDSADLSGANLKGADLTGSHMVKVNLKDAVLRNATLQNCELRLAVLTCADLEKCNLSGSDLHEADLVDANLKDVVT
ncbi:BTB/POZ domain-containing protein KCTD9-like isoform X2 [Amblyomma americanum]